MMERQLFYIIAVVVLMLIASRYMKKIKDKPDEPLPENPDPPVADDTDEVSE
jgi:hypothetical protein